MELEVNIKEEPAWLEGTRNASLENIEHVSDMVVLKNEVKSELTEPWSTQENTLEQSEDIKKEIFIEQYTDDQLLAYIKEETSGDKKAVHQSAGKQNYEGTSRGLLTAAVKAIFNCSEQARGARCVQYLGHGDSKTKCCV
ncbi:uncharacterized protein [Anabrus simplex]|uniref:uncharacterized protein n=1 Tax=Anabrus simplex TaxID=316456 RepID=UPI0035A38DFE